jgi:hypothetical protein
MPASTVILLLGADIDLARRIVADQHHRQTRGDAMLSAKALDCRRHARERVGSNRFSVDQGRRHIVEAEKIVKETTEPDLGDVNNERAVQRFRHAFRAYLVRVAHAKGDMPDHLREVLMILDAHRLEKWPQYRDSRFSGRLIATSA